MLPGNQNNMAYVEEFDNAINKAGGDVTKIQQAIDEFNKAFRVQLPSPSPSPSSFSYSETLHHTENSAFTETNGHITTSNHGSTIKTVTLNGQVIEHTEFHT